ncbi:MAG TPA: 1,4-alpha-glucan branching protein GlgB, partial [Saprospiraceae bacterium]|nr:1,4-alpha-glucan branching protein GlgB [Saprospiraceae bacterium]
MTVIPHSLFTEFDISLFKSGKHFKLYEKLGSHLVEVNGEQGVYFSVWAPDADSVSVMGRFNHWNADSHALNVRWDGSGIWEGFIPGLGNGELYKYGIRAKSGEILEKGDPFARFWEVPPKTASIVWDVEYDWTDGHWLKNRHDKAAAPQPISIYELHMGSWMKIHVEGNRSLSYREMATKLIPYVQKMGFTHVEFMPVMQHPYFQSWGYQITGYFASDSRFGRPEDFMYLVDKLHEAGIGVILDWVPSHFPGDAHGLYQFDGSHLYEHADPKKGYHPDWTSYIFNYGRHEVRSFLISNALFWIDCFHVEGLRVDAVASMLYLDYSRKEGEWEPNQYGGNENLEAVHFLQELNNALHQHFPDALTIAEESTSWSGVTAPTEYGGLGFDRKWMMGWMHDTLRYLQRDPIYRGHHQSELTFS